MPDVSPLPQGYAQPAGERLPLPDASAMTPAQRQAAQALIDGPRKGVYGPFLPLLRSPALLERAAKVGEYLRFESVLDARIRELVTCAVSRHVSNQFEWTMHAPLAVKAGVAEATIEALRLGARPKQLPPDEEVALDFTRELLATHGTSDPTYAAALRAFGEQGLVELASLIGYFVMVCWVMNVARTPAQASAAGPGVDAFPA
ncbi:carboxymuconolactone decarboxylase family protein [Ramlibacter sp. USB13]|uniref:Carboxymuconolactone decarboxylase family protein n=1 Tax=Ramlibacter cellulosilyticus TaxID=2764187 RepID=A0A923SD62_9BURK|nr:carboxymuconolactone decarboxylase family protein [Ramlibacter cellulosilyticus]MBC5785665.1 carboxymuconolactone decarboxylase family protein [Ramlibacter cellulosilyticus]